MAKSIKRDGKLYRIRRGKLVEIPAEWVGKVTSQQTINKRPSTHDCDKCVFLGRLRDYDLYWCNRKEPDDTDLASMLARYGSDGPEYISSHPPDAFCEGFIPSEVDREILSRALAKGLYQPWIRRKKLESLIRMAMFDLECDDIENAEKTLAETGLKP